MPSEQEIRRALDCLSKCGKDEICRLQKEWQYRYQRGTEMPTLLELAVYVLEEKHW